MGCDAVYRLFNKLRVSVVAVLNFLAAFLKGCHAAKLIIPVVGKFFKTIVVFDLVKRPLVGVVVGKGVDCFVYFTVKIILLEDLLTVHPNGNILSV